MDIKVALLTGSQKKSEKKQQLLSIESGESLMIVGTHAIIQEQVNFNKLGLIIIDEQHRFGVEQRMKLRRKCNVDNKVPHMLEVSEA